MPFTVKATYGRSGELRKLSFDKGFPSYEQLYDQLYRVFPISHTYYLSKILFSPDSFTKASILIGREVHTAEQYNSCIAPYVAGAWPNATLRFTVFDETPHKLPAGFVADNTTAVTLAGAGSPAFFASASHIPPPPIILSSTSSSPNGLMDVDSSTQGRYSPQPTPPLKPQHQHDPQSVTAGTPTSCCAVSSGIVEMELMVEKFKSDLERILKTSFATPAPAPLSFMPPLPPLPSSSFCLFKYCTTCAKIFQGPWFACAKCSIVVCLGCHENPSTNNSFCVAAMAPHIMKKEFCAACPVEDAHKVAPFALAPWARWEPLPLRLASPSWPASSQQGYSPAYPFGTPATTLFPGANAPAPAAPAPLPPLPVPAVAQVPEAAAPPAPPVIHRGVVCDMCDNVVEGIRHKCLDCPNYDLCTPCIASGSAERHNPFHEFLEIKEPGRVIVHTVYSGDGERDTPSNTSARALPAIPSQPQAEPALHFATCNLCDSRIRGDRYKCTDCPDFDTCSNCFSITREQHPLHAFVKLVNPSDYIRRDNRAAQMHFVTCNGCSKAIFGVRYKCMHPECPDFDLCDSCEAFPIPMHPDNHPLLKMKSANTVVPTVYRVGQTTLIQREDFQRGRSPAPIRHHSRSPSFDRGFMVNPSKRNMPTSFFDSAPTPIPPPSPFFFRSESSRSSSPALEYMPPPLSPRYAPPIRQPSPMMMPGGLYDEPPFARQPQPSFLPMSHPYPTASRFSHSPSPSPPLFSSRSPTPPHLSRQATWAANHTSRFWPKSSDELRHLMQHDHDAPAPIDAFSRLSVQEEAAVMDSPLTGEALLNRPIEMAQASKAPVTSFNHSLAALLNAKELAPEPVVKNEVPTPTPILKASFVNDVTLPDGQIFPPGAEFMKCWQMVNNGNVEWPPSTELVYVAGERLARENGGPAAVAVGSVKVGGEIELWTGELKAPEAPGRYVSYWRLRDGQGNLFGDSIWIDINVTETRNSNESSSMSSSSIIVMPRGAQSMPTASSTQEGAARVSREDDDDLSENGSDASSVSLISMPTSDDEEWASVPAAEEPQPQRYVVLYDDTSSQSSDSE
ncbi:hypothetical protein B0H15DRAFT_767366 [Mycena belliarum]|uniref:ZZ-type domain-containing protein n=1 Tax=Mycena belliarum TaxID=1033014 RepID=A0AAD6XU70_9AGAR|nr:hypothetical protein B0H15DRAFT_767366 [Mycena belliae]